MTDRSSRFGTIPLAAVALLALVACSQATGPGGAPVPSPTAAPPLSGVGEVQAVRVPLASSDLAIGPNRFAFGVLDSNSRPVRVPGARLMFVYLDSSQDARRFRATAQFVPWPVGRAGVYVASVTFDQAGRWGVEVEVTEEDGAVRVGQAGFVVKPRSSSPAIGQPAPLSRNKTLQDVADLAEITTALVPDPDLYQMTIAQAASSGRPGVVTFATPGFCLTATCGPQVDVVASLKDRYMGQANFVHVEVYDNPKEMEGDLAKGRLSPLLEEWGLLTEPFTFVLDSEGTVSSKFEGFVTAGELEAALVATLGP